MNISRMCLIGLAFAAFALAGCQPGEQPAEQVEEATELVEERAEPVDPPIDRPQAHVVQVTTLDYAFQTPRAISSGWTTFEMTNRGEQEHFMLLWRLPEGRTFEDWVEVVVRPFGQAMEQYEAGNVDREGLFTLLGEVLPEWFFEANTAGGVGLLSPGGIARTAVTLEPGEYVMECYVRNPDGKFHGELGMIQPLTVTGEASGATEPEADVDVTITNYELNVEGEFRRGRQTVRVQVLDDPEGMLSHDIHLARLDGGGSVEEAIAWMDWVDSMQAPAPVKFLGGAEDLPAGNTAYVTVDLEPGEYAWISESYSERGVVKAFRVE